jgi:hypothetical protein
VGHDPTIGIDLKNLLELAAADLGRLAGLVALECKFGRFRARRSALPRRPLDLADFLLGTLPMLPAQPLGATLRWP